LILTQDVGSVDVARRREVLFRGNAATRSARALNWKDNVPVELEPDDQVVIGDGPLHGVVGRLVRFDPPSNTAQVQVWIEQHGQPRRGVAVVSLNLLRAAEERSAALEPPRPAPRRGRPRMITDEQFETMRTMYATGLYSHADIARILGVSKSSVTSHLRRSGE
jgi:DNA-binding CsgD family transcriptional regulator